MPGKSRDLIAEETQGIRQALADYMESHHCSDIEAARAVMKDDSNRRRKLLFWKKLGLWPITGASKVTMEDIKRVKQTVTEDIPAAETLEKIVEQLVLKTMNKPWSKKLIEGHSLPIIPKYRRKFRGPRKSYNMRLPVALCRYATMKARRTGDAALSSDTLTGLIEYLLWQYLNFNEKLVIPEKESSGADDLDLLLEDLDEKP